MLLAFRRDRQLAGGWVVVVVLHDCRVCAACCGYTQACWLSRAHSEQHCWSLLLGNNDACCLLPAAALTHIVSSPFKYSADHLKMPAKIRAGPDGTFDAFVSRFILVNSSGLGYVSLQELNTYLASLSTSSRHHSSSSRVPTAQHGCV